MIFLLDTNAFSDLMREHHMVDTRLNRLVPADRVVVCTIVRGEIRYGLERLSEGRRKQNLEAKAANLFAVIPCEPVSETAGDFYAKIKIARQQKGLSLDENDLWIAATARALGAVLVTRDSDFLHIEGLHVEDWTK